MFSSVKTMLTGVSTGITGPPWTDSFNRADGLVGTDWDRYDGTPGTSIATIVGNAMQGPLNGGTGVNSRYLKGSTNENVGISVTIKGNFQYSGAGSPVGDVLTLQLRANPVGGDITGYIWNIDGSGTRFHLMDHTGSAFLDESAILTVVDGDVFSMEVFGTTVTVYYNNNLIMTATDPSYDLGSGAETAAVGIIRGTSSGNGTSGTASTFKGIDSATVYTAVQPPIRPAPASLVLTTKAPKIRPAVAFVGGDKSQGSSTVPVPAHLALDLILVFAFTDGGGSIGLASGYTSSYYTTNGTWSARLGYKIASATNDSSGTWSGANGIVSVVYRNAGAPLQATGQTGTSASPIYSSISSTGSTSWVGGMVGHKSTNGTLNIAVGTLSTNRVNNEGSTGQGDVVAFDTNGPVTSYAGGTMTGTGETSAGWASVVFEIPNL